MVSRHGIVTVVGPPADEAVPSSYGLEWAGVVNGTPVAVYSQALTPSAREVAEAAERLVDWCTENNIPNRGMAALDSVVAKWVKGGRP
jgi:hypothetical protein